MAMTDSNVVVAAFTEEHVERLTGISRRQLRYWDRIGFFVPSLAYEDRSEAYSRLYSFRDLVSLKVLDDLRNGANVSISHLRKVKEKLSHLGDDVWAKTKLYVSNRKVVFENPETAAREEVLSGQGVMEFALEIVAKDMRNAVEAMRKRDKAEVGKFERHKGVAKNQLMIAGTRISVRSIKAFADAGYSVEAILKEYPSLSQEDVVAAMTYEAAA